ncbi:unnamed protein product [Hyaloperonospora brassicae]|uniref:Sjoegren syndrome/scleroderma autoantigen 1 n=1 Tax=Hyaloperonospora brassicae TaxID=162125 RepID=A0AAV0TT54_HYABA|nr:unnamed protein product [Hyaloperonospora brassicae]
MMAPTKRSCDEASKLLGERMLQGWTMLGLSCPVDDCYTPLVWNKQSRKMFCVRCDQYVVTEEELKQQQAEQKAEEMAANEIEEAEAAARLEAERRHRIEQQFRLEEQAKQARGMQELDQAQAQRGIALQGAAKRKINTAAIHSSFDSGADVNAVRRQTLAALYQKMAALTDSLSPSDHSERLVSVARAVREIAEATRLLEQ